MGGWLRRWLSARRLLGLIVALYLALGGLYSLATPVFEASDELWHYPFVAHLATGRGLPIQQPRAEENLARQEGSQPPLYYLLAAAATFWIEIGPLDQLYAVNPHAKTGVPLAVGNKNLVLHGPEHDFPWRGPALAVQVARGLSLVLGAGTIVCTYLTARTLAPHRTDLALLTAALVAFLPEFLFISASVNNDNLVNLAGAAGLWLALIVAQRGLAWQRVLGLGLVCGVAALAKLSGLGLWPVAALALLIGGWRMAASGWARVRAIGRAFALCFGPALALAGWWYVRNAVLYGDPTGLARMLDIVGRRENVVAWELLRAEWEGFWLSIWGVFGGFNILAEPWVYAIYNGLVLLALVGLALRLGDGLRRGAAWRAHPEWLLPGVWLGLILVALARWTLTTLGSQGRLAFPALAVLAWLCALGLGRLVPTRWAPGALAAVAGGLAILAALQPVRTIWPAYAEPPVARTAAAFQPAVASGATFGAGIRLLGYDLDATELQPGGRLRLRLYWQALAPMEENYSLFIHLFGRDGQRIGQEDSYPGAGAYPTRRWQPGEVIADRYVVSVAPEAVAPSRVEVVIGFYRYADRERLPVFDPQGQPIGTRLVLAEERLPAPAVVLPRLEGEATTLGDVARLLGYTVAARGLAPGQPLRLILYWQALRDALPDYTVFAQLLDGNRVIAQQDSPPVAGNYPTRLWRRDEVIEDVRMIAVPAGTPPGRLRLIVGLYDVRSGVRLVDNAGRDAIDLGEVLVR